MGPKTDRYFARAKVGGKLIRQSLNTREVRWVPMNTAMITLLKRLRAERADEPPTAAVMRIQECQKAMDRACRELGIDHDLRHFFATTCIEAGIDIPTVSRWLGHKDGGALAMRVYGHLRNQHSQAMAQRVIFGRVPAEAPTAPARSTLVGASP
jgi:integrase